MVTVLVHANEWLAARKAQAYDPNNQTYHLKCGLIIPCENVLPPMTFDYPAIYFIDLPEVEATLFLIAVGGSIRPKGQIS